MAGKFIPQSNDEQGGIQNDKEVKSPVWTILVPFAKQIAWMFEYFQKADTFRMSIVFQLHFKVIHHSFLFFQCKSIFSVPSVSLVFPP
jgi:hypothetical protein